MARRLLGLALAVVASASGCSALPSPPGLTRSLVGLDYALITPESRTWAAAAAPGNSDPAAAKNSRWWSNASVAHLVSPGRAGAGAAFSMFLVKLGARGSMGPPPSLFSSTAAAAGAKKASAERFVFVLDGVVEVKVEAEEEDDALLSPQQRRRERRRRERCSPRLARKGGVGYSGGSNNFTLRADGFAFFPPHCSGLLPSVTAGPGGAGLVVFERVHVSRATGKASKPFDGGGENGEHENDGGGDNGAGAEEEETSLPSFVWGPAASKLPLLDPGHPETFKLRKLLPHSGPDSLRFDFNVHLMDFEPGEFLATKEIHHNQHGLLMLQGQGIYRLSNDVWLPVVAGDAIYMGPYVTQWFGSLGRDRSRYLIFKDTAPDPLLAGGGGFHF